MLFRVIVRLGWHPMMRVRKGGTFRPAGWGVFHPLTKLLPDIGGTFRAEGRAYATEKLPCTLLARWDDGYSEPWFILTDLPPEAAGAVWHGLRTWIEQWLSRSSRGAAGIGTKRGWRTPNGSNACGW